ncbi:MAG: phosphatidylserine decarboxylase [Planctomycetota bacterium]
MSKDLRDWIESDVQPVRDRPLSWLSEHHVCRDPLRPTYADGSYFYSPADGVILYQKTVGPDEAIAEVKGKGYSLRDALRDDGYDEPSFVIGIFMTLFDVHVNRIPYAGRLSYRLLEPIDTHNRPMLDVERSILDESGLSLAAAEYLRCNERVVNRVDSVELGQSYRILQIADRDIDSITPFRSKQNEPCAQGARFSRIRRGAQVDLIVPLSPVYDFVATQPTGCHVEAGLDTLIALRRKAEPSPSRAPEDTS